MGWFILLQQVLLCVTTSKHPHLHFPVVKVILSQKVKTAILLMFEMLMMYLVMPLILTSYK